MNNFIEKLGEKLMPIATKLGQNRYLLVLRDAFMLSFPLTMFGSIIVVLNHLPFFSPETQGMLNGLFSSGQNATMSILSVFVTFGIGYYLSKSYDVEAVFGGVISLAAFLILTPFHLVTESGETVGGVLALDRLGAKGMFIGMIAAFVAAEIYSRLTKKGFTITMPDGVPPAVAKSFSALIPAIATLTLFNLLNAFVTGALNINLHDWIYNVIQIPLTGLGTSLGGTLVAVFFVQLLWFFGLHGQVIVNSVMDPIWLSTATDNYAQFTAGAEELPHIVTKPFMETYTVGMGGSGSTLIVVILMAFFMKSRQMKEVGRLAIGPGIFNVNEPAIFGLPIVLNAAIFIPWVLAPMVTTAFNYTMLSLELFPKTTGAIIPWTIPFFINGSLATNSIMGGVLQLISMVIIGVIWYPFLKLIDKQNLAIDLTEPELT